MVVHLAKSVRSTFPRKLCQEQAIKMSVSLDFVKESCKSFLFFISVTFRPLGNCLHWVGIGIFSFSSK